MSWSSLFKRTDDCSSERGKLFRHSFLYYSTSASVVRVTKRSLSAARRRPKNVKEISNFHTSATEGERTRKTKVKRRSSGEWWKERRDELDLDAGGQDLLHLTTVARKLGTFTSLGSCARGGDRSASSLKIEYVQCTSLNTPHSAVAKCAGRGCGGQDKSQSCEWLCGRGDGRRAE